MTTKQAHNPDCKWEKTQIKAMAKRAVSRVGGKGAFFSVFSYTMQCAIVSAEVLDAFKMAASINPITINCREIFATEEMVRKEIGMECE